MKILVVVGSLLLAACASNPKPLYEWGDYSRALLKYSKNPSETQVFADKLRKAIEKGETVGRVPPGLYAEYGYTQYDLGHVTEAVVYFGKERDKWPESRFIMEKIIQRLSRPAGVSGVPAASQPTPPAVPATTPSSGRGL